MELHDLTALEQARAIRRGEVSSVELAGHYLAPLARPERRGRRLRDSSPTSWPWRRPPPPTGGRRGRTTRATCPCCTGSSCPSRTSTRCAACAPGSGRPSSTSSRELDDDVVRRLRDGGTVMTGKTTHPGVRAARLHRARRRAGARTPWDLDPVRGRIEWRSGGRGRRRARAGRPGLGRRRLDPHPGERVRAGGLKPSRGLVSNGPMPEAIGRLGVQGVPRPHGGRRGGAARRHDGPTDGAYLGGLGIDPASLLVGRYREPVIADTVVHPECVRGLRGRVRAARVARPPASSTSTCRCRCRPCRTSRRCGRPARPASRSPRASRASLRPLTRWLRERGRALTPEEVRGRRRR